MISVIIPVYNVENYLDKCLQSVLTNTYRDLEVICVNDGSTDNGLEIMKKWQARDPRVIIVSHENRGLPEARNSGLEVATGEYTAFIDEDDWVHPRYFESMLDCMEKNKADMVVAGVQLFGPHDEISIDPGIEPLFHQLTAAQFFKNTYGKTTVWAKLLRRRDTSSLRFPPEVDARQDNLYNLRLIASLEHPIVYATDTLLYYYLQHSNSLLRTRTYNTVLEIADWYVAHGQNPLYLRTGEWSWMLLLHCIKTVLSSCYMAILYKDRDAIKHTNLLLRAMLKDLMKNWQLSFGRKLTYANLILFPEIYHGARIISDPTMLKFERNTRNHINAS